MHDTESHSEYALPNVSLADALSVESALSDDALLEALLADGSLEWVRND